MTGLNIKQADWSSLATCPISQHRLSKSGAMCLCQAVDAILSAWQRHM